MPKKERRMALFSSLSAKAKDKSIFALEGLDLKAPKTKVFSELLSKLPETNKILFVLPGKNLLFEKSNSNIPGVHNILVHYLNPYDVLHVDKVCFLTDAFKKLEEVFLSDSK